MPHLVTHSRLRVLLIADLLFLPISGFTQIPEDFETLAEDHAELEESASLPTEILEERADRLNAPLNLNRATEEPLRSSGLFTPFQVHVLLDYREKYGELYSIYELASLPGFSVSHLKEISGYLTTGSAVAGSAGTGAAPGNMLMVNTGRIFPRSSGYTAEPGSGNTPVYSSTPLKINFRIRARLKKNLALGLAFDKDPGEPCFQGMHPEFASGHIHYRGTGTLRQLVIGSYRLNHGLGLVNGTGFLHTPSGFRMNRLSLSALKPYASLNENRFHNGMAARIKIRETGCLLWSSYKRLDLSLFRVPEHFSSVDWLDFQRTGGMHRTPVEIEGRSLAFHHHSGIQLVQQHRNLTLGVMAGTETTSLTAKGNDSLQTRTNPSWHSALSLHWLWVSPAAKTFGELVLRDLNSVALLTGLRVHFSDFLQGLLLLHHYGITFRGIHPSSYASGSHIRNEEGISLHLLAEPGRRFKASFTCALFHYPSPRYLTGVPSTGFRNRYILQSAGKGSLQWKLQLEKKVWQKTPSGDSTGSRSMITSARSRMSLQFRYTPLPAMQWQSRMILSLLSGGKRARPGYITYHQVRIHTSGDLTCTLRFLVFNVTDWDNRIYIHEPGLYYSFSFPAFYGKGQKVNSVISLKTGKKLTVAGTFSILSYADRDHIGSGNDLIPGSRKWEAEIQLRLNF